jgi:hypothetical protein
MSDKKNKSDTLKLMKVRASFPILDKPRAFEEGKKPKYEITLLIPKSRDITEIKKAVFKAKKLKFGADKDAWPKFKYPSPIMDGDEKSDIDGYAGHWYIKATSERKPAIVDLDVEPIGASEIYAGCYINAGINIVAYEYKQGKLTSRGVAAYIEAVQLDNEKAGKPFSSASSAEDIFGKGKKSKASRDDEDEEDLEDKESDDLDSDDEDDQPAPKSKKKTKRPSLDEDEDDAEDLDD